MQSRKLLCYYTSKIQNRCRYETECYNRFEIPKYDN